MKTTSVVIKLSTDDYIKIIAGKPIQIPAANLLLGKEYKLVNIVTKTHLFRYPYSIIGDWSYWK
ncbi:MAG: hypothetical protein V7K21_19280 [Nostoc sp.]|uniref:hypothetical protein n=1 Tax=Nostoc sp. TaxID=1180 RepID=UPI002FF52699